MKADEHEEFLHILIPVLHKTLGKPSKTIVECENIYYNLMLCKFGNCYVHA